MDQLIEVFSRSDAWVALLSLTVLEIILGIDNIVFIAVLTDRVPIAQQKLAYRLGLGAAMFSRIALLFAITWVMHATTPLLSLRGHDLSFRDLVLLLGGLYLMTQSAREIYEKVEHGDLSDEQKAAPRSTLASVVLRIMIIDIVFSLDSVITAVGMAEDIEVMIAAVVIAVAIMLVFARPVGEFVNRHPSMKVLALSFLMLIGVLLVGEAFGQHFNKGYVYFAMAFSLTVELLNMRFRKKSTPLGGQH